MSAKAVEFNKDELVPPEWMNKDFFLKVLHNCEKGKDIKDLNLDIAPATAKGDHYASIMFRVTVEYSINGERKKRSMIVKTMPEIEGTKKDMFEESHIFETEINMYKEVLPKFTQILRKAGDDTQLGPECLFEELSPKKVIVFDDLVPLGFSVLRDRSISLEEAHLAYSKIAKWHAISYKLNQEEPQFFDKYRHGIFNEASLIESECYKDGIKNFIDMLDANQDLNEYKKYFLPLKDNLIHYCEIAYSEFRKNPNPEALYVLCHGDFHSKNIMLKENPKSGKLEDLLLLDYQFSYFGPIGNDILYSKYLLLDEKMRTEDWDELLFFYFTTFQETLRKIGYQKHIPTVIELRRELLRHKNFDLFLLTTFLPIWFAFSSGELDGDDILTSAELRKDLYKRPEYLIEVRKLLPRYLHCGLLEN